MNFLQDKKVLFIGQVFYDYHTQIIKQLTTAGAQVVFYENMRFREDPAVSNDLISAAKRLLNPGYKQNYTQKILQETRDGHFDYLLCVGGFSITKELIEGIKAQHPGIVTILYLWDSLTIYNYTRVISYFDSAFSFESEDCKKYPALRYIPLFYTSEYDINNNTHADQQEDIDLVYIGAVGPFSWNRSVLLRKIEKICTDKQLKTFLFLYASPSRNNVLVKTANILRALIFPSYGKYVREISYSKANHSFISSTPLSRTEVADLVARARCILDIPVPGQFGLTIRTIEALAHGKKIITTNQSIRNEKFYNSNMIAILDENNVKIDADFIHGGKTLLSIEHLHIRNWVKNLFNGNAAHE